ncbi:phage major capsid protein, partial [Actinocorallia libanotica]
TDQWRGVTSAGVNWSYDAEASAVSDDSPTLAQPVVDAHEARGFIPFSLRVGQDYPGFAEEMARLLVEGYDELQANKHAVGSGAGEPFGILTALDANTNVEVVVTTDGAFGGADVNKVWGALPDRYKANSRWVMSTEVGDEISAFGNGNNISWYTVDLTGTLEKIKNRPVEYSSYFPAYTATTGAENRLVVGDFRNYLIVQRVGMTVELIPHLFDQATGRPTGQRGWFAYARDGADSINDQAFRLLQNQ